MFYQIILDEQSSWKKERKEKDKIKDEAIRRNGSVHRSVELTKLAGYPISKYPLPPKKKGFLQIRSMLQGQYLQIRSTLQVPSQMSVGAGWTKI